MNSQCDVRIDDFAPATIKRSRASGNRAATRIVTMLSFLALACGVASGNGRAPATNGIVFRSGDPRSLYVASTFGLLISHDDGCTFRWYCENTIGYGGTYDPKYAVASDGAIFAATYSGLRVSRDDGCSFVGVTDDLPPGDPGRIDRNIGALEIDASGAVWLATADSAGNAIYRSGDGGHTFAAVVTQPATMLWASLKVAPSNSNRVYVTGLLLDGSSTGTAYFASSTDGGMTWTQSALGGVTFGGVPVVRVMAIDPANPEIVYLVSDQASEWRLYRSDDGGATLTEVLRTTEELRSVVVLPGQVYVAAGRAYYSSDGKSFRALDGSPRLSCLGARSDGSLVGCGTNWDPDFKALAVSGDQGATWDPLWRFVQIAGPAECPAGTAEHDICADMTWPVLKSQFGATGPTCGDFVWGRDTPGMTSSHAGCCDAGNAGRGGAAMMSLLVVLVLTRRKRHSSQLTHAADPEP